MRVLIADDHAATCDGLAALLRCWGFDPVTVPDGKTALAALRGARAPTLAVLDWIMPELNGIDVCRAIRENTDRPYIYVVLVTGQGDKQQMLEGMEAGADDYLVKPIDPNELHARLTAGKRIACLQAQLLVTQKHLREQATRDALTGLWNRATIMEALAREMERSGRERQPMSVILADLDHFKHINDLHGHLAGDQVLRVISQRLLAELRSYDALGRYGGEELLAVLPGCDAATGLALAERLCQRVAAEAVSDDAGPIAVTLSLGVATWDGKMSAADFLRMADRALYQAKNAGRNRAIHCDGRRAPMSLGGTGDESTASEQPRNGESQSRAAVSRLELMRSH